MVAGGTRWRASALQPKRWWQMRQHLRIQVTTQMHQQPGLSHVDNTVAGTLQRSQCELNGSEAPAQPTHSRRQRQRQLPHHRGRLLDAWRPGDDCDYLLDLDKQPRQASGHEVRQQAERAVSLWAIPTGHAKALRSGPRVAAVACETAAPAGVQRAHGQGRVAPLLGRDVRIDA